MIQPRDSTWFEEISVSGMTPRMTSLTKVSSTHSRQEPRIGPKIVAAPPNSRMVQV